MAASSQTRGFVSPSKSECEETWLLSSARRRARSSRSAAVSQRAESIIIYATDEAASGRVLDWLRAYRASNPDHFMRSAPPMTQQVLEGVSVGMEPAVSGTSFGALRAKLITQALQETAGSQDQAAFVHRVLELFRREGIDPGAPHLNLPRGTE